jgi:hypothetical protein
MSEYSIEYSTALLMNLCLRSEGKQRASNPSMQLLEMLADYLESENEQVRTYVNGTMYSVLSLPSMKVRCCRAAGVTDWPGAGIAPTGGVRSTACLGTPNGDLTTRGCVGCAGASAGDGSA